MIHPELTDSTTQDLDCLPPLEDAIKAIVSVQDLEQLSLLQYKDTSPDNTQREAVAKTGIKRKMTALLTAMTTLLSGSAYAPNFHDTLQSSVGSFSPSVVGPGYSAEGAAQSSASGANQALLYYYWVGGVQFAAAEGASADITQALPSLAPDADHSLTELWVGSKDKRNAVEVGWDVEPGILGAASKPELFVDSWVNGQATCYDTCGFEQVSKDIKPGDALRPDVGKFAIRYAAADGQWQIWYDDREVGYYPGSQWNDSFRQATLETVYGEVSTFNKLSCTGMGDGKLGTSAGSARVSNFALIGANVQPQLVEVSVAEALSAFDSGNNKSQHYDGVPTDGLNVPYNAEQFTSTSFSFGGPGSCHR